MIERGLFELRDGQLGTRVWSRRRFLGAGAAVGLQRALACVVPYARFMPVGLVPVAMAQSAPGSVLSEASGLRVLNDRPLNAETPAHLLDDEVTPAARLFVRNNGIPPANVDAGGWQTPSRGRCSSSAIF